MKRPGLIIIFLLLVPAVFLAWLTATDSGLRWAYQKAGPYLPGGLKINKLQGRLIGPITLENFEFRQDGMIIKADQIMLDWHPGTLPAGNVDISSLRIKSLSIVLPEAEKTGQALSLPEISLPWRTALKDGQIDGFSLSRNDQTIKLRRIRLKAGALFSKVNIKDLSVSADSFNLNIKGKLQPTRSYHHDLEIKWRLKLPSGEMVDGNGQVAGDVQTTRLEQQLGGPLQLTLDAELKDLLDQLKWQAKVDVKPFKASQLDSRLPAFSGALRFKANGDLSTATVSGTVDDAAYGNHPEIGTFSASFQLQCLSDKGVRIERLTLHSPGSGTRIDSHGLWTPGGDGGKLELALDWQNLRWPMQEPAWFKSASGSGSVEGTLNSYKIKLSSDSPWPELLPSTWSAEAEGNLDGLSIRSLRVAALGGEATATGQIKWSPEPSWQLKVSATDIDPAGLWPKWPGLLKAELTSRGSIENGQMLAYADITRLTGRLRAYPVSLQSSLIWRDNGLDVALLDLHSGKSRTTVKGRLGETMKLDWAIESNNLAELYPRAKGELHAEGHLAGPRDVPTLQATFKGEALEMPGYRIGSIGGKVSVDLYKWQQLDINLAAQMLDLGAYSLQSLNLSSAGQVIEIKALSEKMMALAKLQGIRDAQGWHGRIEQLELGSRQFHKWQLKAPVGLDITEKTVHAQPICLLSKDSEVCMELQKQGDAWQARLDALQIPLMLLAPWLPDDLKIEGNANAKAELEFQAPDQLLGQGKIELQAGTVSYPLLEGEHDLWEYGGGTVIFAMNEQGINAGAEIAMSNGDRLHFKADLPGANILALDYRQQSLRAEAGLSVHDLGLIEALLPEVQDLKGGIALNLSAAGTLAQPRLGGDVQLLNGSLRIPRLGLTITQISLSGQSHDSEKLDFRLDAHSGEGKLTIRGQTMLKSDKGWPTTISVKGSEFEVSRIPEARVLVTPDLHIEQKNRKITIRGNINIPYAKLQPKDISTAARVSEDAVIIGGEKLTEEKWLIDTRIRLTLGERVHFYGFGFDGRLEGSLLLEDEPGHISKATGEISIPEGHYRAYGQRLDIELGRLLYTGGSLTNPGLDLRAVRHVGNISAGLKVRGSLDKPRLELFSSPAMGQTDALAYLMLGGPIDKASGEEGAMMAQAALAMGLGGSDHIARILGDRFGLDAMRVESSDTGKQASLVVGRYLSPRLYVSYGVGLIEAFNTLTLRYKITDKWQIKAESGEYQGADILYTIER